MGSVYVARHTQLDRKAAIKALHPNLVNNPQIRERFKNEAATMARLKHPNIVSLYDYLESNEGLFLIMEFVEGYPLDTYLQKMGQGLPESQAIQLFSQILDGFAYAHQRSIVHRDIKPSNLLVSPQGEVKILDFGIAKLLDAQSKSMTKTGTRMGTVLYMSPEQVKGQNLDQRSDIYALGVTLFQTLSGECPYDEHNATEYEVYQKIVNEPLPRLHSYGRQNPRMQAIIDKATAKNPAERFANCEAFYDALLGKSSLSTENTSSTTIATEKASPKTSPDLPPSSRSSASWVRRYLYRSLAIMLLLGGIASIILFNPFRIKALEPYAYLQKKQSAEPEELKERLRSRMQQFYRALESKDFSNVRPFFADEVLRYFSYENVKPQPDISASQKLAWERYQYEKHEVMSDSFTYETDEAGNYILTYDYRYTFKLKEEEAKSVSRTARIKMTSNWRIFYIENI